ncbi:hypothetical protein FA13DRAFT_1770737 [Coprinellus micaceus]|uniref:LysM domain-containing protein n=1 Tax=Coprinellus micaceus TaxID=71717 RepID=A0A4Y7TWZ9_COPMI|nr:hypothetical protein FA13DRAFT_1770737 [Coprinellus micaceus]
MNPKELDLTFNPFDDDGSTDEATPQNQLYFGSAFLPNATTPTTRRRSSFGSSNGSSSAIRKRHTRSRTEFNLDIADQELSGHPLKSAALRSAAFQDFDITRPHLSRIVQSTGVLRRSRSQEPEESGNRSPPVKEEEKEVIIHEITSKDSLAGVSLRYGIPLPELRRANQLWASDSIHLRKVLYIPIDRAKRAHEYIVAGLQRSAPPSPPPWTRCIYHSHSVHEVRPLHTLHPPARPGVSNPRIQKMPASQLSFFPPSTNPSRVQTPAATPSPVKTEFNTQRAPYLKPNAGTRTGSSPANSLSSLLNTFPIAASTRDEIVSRLSFDSLVEGHLIPPHATQARPLLSTSPPSSYVPQQPYNPYVRTQQLEPSPVMQIPSKGGRAVGRTQSLGRASSKDFAKLSLYPPTIGEPRGKPVKNSGSNAGTGE